MIETKQKILDTAERLFATQGYGATSMRQIIAEAGVNLAAIHYHFGSKEELLDGLIVRKAGPVNEKRLTMLGEVMANRNGHPVELEEILRAFFAPLARGADDKENDLFMALMGRLFAEGLFADVVRKHFRGVVTKFLEALRIALPEVPEEELLWRFHFMVGALSHTMCGQKQVPELTCLSDGFGVRLERLSRFVAAGFRAPAGAANLEVKE